MPRSFEVPVVMPGLWDCHAHLFGSPSWSLEGVAWVPPAAAGARATADLRNYIEGGVTSVREVGGYGVELAPVVAEGSIVGPSIYGAGEVLSTTGGHGDIHSIPLDIYAGISTRSRIIGRLADGPSDCIKAVREQLRRNARVIKICACGGVMSEVDHPIHQQFSDEELQAIVAEAARAERVVAAHCHGKPGIMAALKAGVKTIEHGSYLDEEAAELMKEKDAILVPTRFIVEELLEHGGRGSRLRLSKDHGPRRYPRPGDEDRDSRRRADRHGHRHLSERPGARVSLRPRLPGAQTPDGGRTHSPTSDRGGDRHRADDSRTTGPQIRSVAGRI